MERSKIVCQHLPVKSIQEVRQLVQTYSPKVSRSPNTTPNPTNDGKKKSSNVSKLLKL